MLDIKLRLKAVENEQSFIPVEIMHLISITKSIQLRLPMAMKIPANNKFVMQSLNHLHTKMVFTSPK